MVTRASRRRTNAARRRTGAAGWARASRTQETGGGRRRGSLRGSRRRCAADGGAGAPGVGDTKGGGACAVRGLEERGGTGGCRSCPGPAPRRASRYLWPRRPSRPSPAPPHGVPPAGGRPQPPATPCHRADRKPSPVPPEGPAATLQMHRKCASVAPQPTPTMCARSQGGKGTGNDSSGRVPEGAVRYSTCIGPPPPPPGGCARERSAKSACAASRTAGSSTWA